MNMKTSNKEPEVAVKATLEDDEFIGNIKIYSLTCARYAILSQLGSPFIDSSVEYDINSLIPTVYVLTQDFSELRKYIGDIEELKRQAYDAAEEIDVSQFDKIVQKILDKFNVIQKVSPNVSTGEKKTVSPEVTD